MQLVDIGANLSHSSFQQDLAAVLQRARAGGVAQLVVTGASREGSPQALELAQAHPGLLYATAGIHPHHATEYDADTDALLRELVAAAEVRAVGETGLDYHRDLSPRATQQFAFEQQLQIGLDCGKPLFLHQRDAHGDFMAILKSVRDRLGAVVVHCFTGTREELFDYLDLDCHIGITGWICDERRGLHLREIVGNIPLNRLMNETDSPYLLPRDLRPMPSHRRNEPMYLAHICAAVAQSRGETPAITAAATTATARQFFNLPEIPA